MTTTTTPELQTRRAPPTPITIDPESRQFTAVIATDADVRITLPDGRTVIERLLCTPDAVDVSRVESGAVPLLDGHRQETRNVVGRLLAVTFEPGRIVGRFVFTSATDAQPLWERVVDGSLRSVSAGYSRLAERHLHTAPDGTPVVLTTRWALHEVSLVSIPADARATVRSDRASDVAHSKDTKMDTEAAPAAPATDEALAERQRITNIDAAVEAARSLVPADRAFAIRAEAIASGWTPDDTRKALFDEMVRSSKARPTIPASPTSWDVSPHEATLAARAEAIAARALGRSPSDRAREFMGASVATHARELLLGAGQPVSRYASDHEIIGRALTTSDFPALLQSAAERSLQQLVAADSPVRALCRRREVRDFRQIEAITFSGPGTLTEVLEGGEVQHAPPAERREVGRVRTFARAMEFSRQALVNDDLGAFAEPLRLFASAVAEAEATEFVAQFAANGTGWGASMSDNKPLFHADHGNVASGTMSTAGIAAARLVMRGQRLPGGGLARVNPRHILVGPSNETLAEQALHETAIATTEGDRPVFGGRLTLHVEPRLTGSVWFLAADPAEVAAFEFVTLANTGGNPVAQVYDAGPARLGVTMRVVHDFAVMPAGWVGWVRATGT
jgi:phage head maturation protease